MKKILLFIVPFFVMTAAVVGYFKLTQKISAIKVPVIPSVSFSDIVKLSRFSLEKAPSDSLTATVSAMTGDVFYTSRIATEAAKINSPVTVQQGESLATGKDGTADLTFKDIADVTINSDSGVNVIQTLPADLVFQQSMGSVDYKKLGSDPVSVRVGHLLVENGGEVKISFTAVNPITTLVVINGTAVVAYNNLYDASRVINLKTGQTLKFNESNRKVTVR